jgi:hypothetical protein
MNMFKKILLGVSLAVVLALSLVIIVFAQEPVDPEEDVCPFGGACGGFGHGMGGFGYRGTMPTVLAEELGMTLEELYAALDDGKTIAEVAADQGIALADLVAALVAQRAEDLSKAVADGYLTQDQADLMLEEMTEHLTWRLENLGLGGCGMRGGGPGYRHGRGMHGGGRGMHGGGWGNGAPAPRTLSNKL